MTTVCYLLGWSESSVIVKVWKEKGGLRKECGRGCNENRGGPRDPFIELQNNGGM